MAFHCSPQGHSTFMDIVVDSLLWMRADGPKDEELLDRLGKRLTFRNPKHRNAATFGKYAGHLSKKLNYVVEARPGVYWAPRGALGILQRLARDAGTQLSFESRVTCKERPRVPVEDLGRELRPYQLEALEHMVDRVQGHVVFPPGAGKTVLACAALAVVDQSAVVLVHTEEIADQWVGHLGEMYDPKVRVVGYGKRDLRPLRDREVAVCSVQMLARARKKARPLLRSAGALVVDEAHRSPSRSFSSAVNQCPARYRWFLTATPDRADGLGFVIGLLSGPCLMRKSLDDLVELGYLHRPRVFAVRSGWSPDEVWHKRWQGYCPECGWVRDVPREAIADPDVAVLCGNPDCDVVLEDDHVEGTFDHTRSVSDLARDEQRNELLVRLCRIGHEHGHRTLCLVPRVELTGVIARQLKGAGVPAVGLHSKASYRKQRLEQFRRGAVSTLVATSLADEGLDIPELSFLVNGNPSKAAGATVQRSGRSMRPQGLAPVIVDIVDGGGHERQFSERERTYRREIGAEVQFATVEQVEAFLRDGAEPPLSADPGESQRTLQFRTRRSM